MHKVLGSIQVLCTLNALSHVSLFSFIGHPETNTAVADILHDVRRTTVWAVMLLCSAHSQLTSVCVYNYMETCPMWTYQSVKYVQGTCKNIWCMILKLTLSTEWFGKIEIKKELCTAPVQFCTARRGQTKPTEIL